MTDSAPANLEMAIVLPLGVIANQLRKIEADLRLLNMKAVRFAKDGDNARHTALIYSRLEHIDDALDSIGKLVADIGSDLRPRGSDVKTPDRDD